MSGMQVLGAIVTVALLVYLIAALIDAESL